MSNKKSAILLIHCKDQPGIVVAITDFIFSHGGNIINLDQHVDTDQQRFFMRVEWELQNFSLPVENIGNEFDIAVATRFGMQRQLHFSSDRPRMAVFVSKLPHCFYDLLSRYEAGEWQVSIPLIISNHNDMSLVAERFNIDYFHVPIDKKNKLDQEKKQLELLEDYKIDFIVLARYMQILSEDFIDRFPQRIINIHHSFLPAFPGGRPYHSAFERGVKIIGATSHYVTADLDAGPIIEQDVVHVSHKDTVVDMVRKGRDLEKVVLARAIWHQLNHNLLVCENRTVVFD
ncbi:MAG: formyltetrahydrofolate deformylase [Gammaproteobacteria bacterium]|nr:formyltetrahydrofolate deformylase [Gammaproteobacteria bacterium]NNJ97150.1 formyltetrahydrofolate deformylase [Gammaproteobacteria bacterium]